MKFPDDLEIPDSAVQQIQISHNFTESYIITEEKAWSSVSSYNPETELIVVLVLEKYDDGNDFIIVLEEFNKELNKGLDEEELERHLESLFKLSLTVFRARDAVFTKLSNEMAELKMKVFFYERRFNKVLQSEQLDDKCAILYLLSMNDEMSVKEISKQLKKEEEIIGPIMDGLERKDVLAHDPEKDVYYLKFT